MLWQSLEAFYQPDAADYMMLHEMTYTLLEELCTHRQWLTPVAFADALCAAVADALLAAGGHAKDALYPQTRHTLAEALGEELRKEGDREAPAGGSDCPPPPRYRADTVARKLALALYSFSALSLRLPEAPEFARFPGAPVPQ